jgi:hypothetical protein
MTETLIAATRLAEHLVGPPHAAADERR